MERQTRLTELIRQAKLVESLRKGRGEKFPNDSIEQKVFRYFVDRCNMHTREPEQGVWMIQILANIEGEQRILKGERNYHPGAHHNYLIFNLDSAQQTNLAQIVFFVQGFSFNAEIDETGSLVVYDYYGRVVEVGGEAKLADINLRSRSQLNNGVVLYTGRQLDDVDLNVRQRLDGILNDIYTSVTMPDKHATLEIEAIKD